MVNIDQDCPDEFAEKNWDQDCPDELPEKN